MPNRLIARRWPDYKDFIIRTLQGSSPIRARVGNPSEPHPQTDLPYVLIGDDAAFVAETTVTLAIMTPFSHLIRLLNDHGHYYKYYGCNHLFLSIPTLHTNDN
jgi:hypothetical protein